MHLSTLVVSGFRTIKKLEVSFGPGLNVIVGENNIGKTALIDAIRAGLGPASSGGDSVYLRPTDIHISGSDSDEPVRIDLWFSGLTEVDHSEFVTALNLDLTDKSQSTVSVHYQWSWNEDTGRFSHKRYGGDRGEADAQIPDDVLQSIPITHLGALRDATLQLAPGRESRLARLLAESASSEEKNAIESIVREANKSLESDELVKRAEALIQQALVGASGKYLAQDPRIRTMDPQFEYVVRGLRLLLAEEGQIPDDARALISSNGLGYNNLLYIAVVLAELERVRNANLPILLIEEPEAHLHPQLQEVLVRSLHTGGVAEGQKTRVQTIVTTHSPVIASVVDPSSINVLHDGRDGHLKSFWIGSRPLDTIQTRQLRRVLDATKAAMFFSKGVILTEGTSETILLPILAERAGIDLKARGVSVIPVFGVDFLTVAQLFMDGIDCPVAIVTDGDPEITFSDAPEKKRWQSEIPRYTEEGGVRRFNRCARVVGLEEACELNENVVVCSSEVTFEHDLAAAGDKNPMHIAAAWETLMSRPEKSLLTQQILGEFGDDRNAKAIHIWRVICRATPSRGKAELAQALADRLQNKNDSGQYVIPPTEFGIPGYLHSAIKHVAGN